MRPTCARSPAGRATTRWSSCATRKCPRTSPRRSSPRRARRSRPRSDARPASGGPLVSGALLLTPRQIATNQAAVVCDVCGRTLLRGEEASVFLAGGARRVVCELSTPRAANGGWIREGPEEGGLGMRPGGREGRGSFLSRPPSRREVVHTEANFEEA